MNKRFIAAIAFIAAVSAALCIGAAKRIDTVESGAAVEYTGTVEHIFTHELVYDTEKAFAQGNKLRDCFDKDHLTAKEFGALLNSLYDRGYVLVGLDRVLNGSPLMLEADKKPIVISFDDMTYDTADKGCIDKIFLKDGKLYDYAENAEPQVTRERENITLLESFIEAHPDFSPFGDRATVCVNGYNGLLGYRVTPDCKVSDEKLEKDTRECKTLIEGMKDLGYTFASHTYYHSYFNGTSAKGLERDCKKWQTYIRPIVGETRVLCYPAGIHDAKSVKNEIFKRYGFDVFLCVGSFGCTDYEKSRTDETYIYRKAFDGTSLRLYGELYSHLADTAAIYDASRFRPFSYKGNYRFK